jgi:hypothetical protein
MVKEVNRSKDASGHRDRGKPPKRILGVINSSRHYIHKVLGKAGRAREIRLFSEVYRRRLFIMQIIGRHGLGKY